ncbi:MAG: hypothetical protein IJW49_06990 [Clostridia bacterium]|nr:hypothetical protein [Clostridia bacterium]
MYTLNKLTWTIQGKNSEHKIALNRGVNIRDPMSLVVDGELVDYLQIPATSILAKLEHSFTCDGTTVTLLLFATKADIVVNGVFQGSKRKYKGYPKMGWWFLVLMALLNFSPAFVFNASYILPSFCIFLTWFLMMSPFQSRLRKVIFSLLISMFGWGMSLLLWYWSL